MCVRLSVYLVLPDWPMSYYYKRYCGTSNIGLVPYLAGITSTPCCSSYFEYFTPFPFSLPTQGFIMHLSSTPPPPGSTFPQNPEEFDADPRVSFSKLSNKFLLETDDGQEYEYDDALKRWVPVVRLSSSHEQQRSMCLRAAGNPLFLHTSCPNERFLIASRV